MDFLKSLFSSYDTFDGSKLQGLISPNASYLWDAPAEILKEPFKFQDLIGTASEYGTNVIDKVSDSIIGDLANTIIVNPAKSWYKFGEEIAQTANQASNAGMAFQKFSEGDILGGFGSIGSGIGALKGAGDIPSTLFGATATSLVPATLIGGGAYAANKLKKNKLISKVRENRSRSKLLKEHLSDIEMREKRELFNLKKRYQPRLAAITDTDERKMIEEELDYERQKLKNRFNQEKDLKRISFEGDEDMLDIVENEALGFVQDVGKLGKRIAGKAGDVALTAASAALTGGMGIAGNIASKEAKRYFLSGFDETKDISPQIEAKYWNWREGPVEMKGTSNNEKYPKIEFGKSPNPDNLL